MRADLEEWADRVFSGELRCAKRKTFSSPSWYRGKKMLAFLHGDALGIKLPPERVLEMIASDPDVFGPFNPGRDVIMRNWLMITRPEAEEYEQDRPLIEEALFLIQ
jgi:hypothetical protein